MKYVAIKVYNSQFAKFLEDVLAVLPPGAAILDNSYITQPAEDESEDPDSAAPAPKRKK